MDEQEQAVMESSKAGRRLEDREKPRGEQRHARGTEALQ